MGGGDAGGGRGGQGGSRETAGGEVSGGRHRFRALGSRGYTEPGADDTWQGGGRRAAAGRSGPVEGRGPATGPGAPRPIARRRGGTALLAGRYALTAAVRRTAGQAVFLARDTVEGSAITDVVVKQARADGEAGAVLRHEAALLERLDGHGLVPRPIRLVEQGGSVFLVREHLTGRPLGSWAEGARLAGGGRPDADWAEVRAVALALIGLVERVHAFGLVLRDLSPGGVLVLPDGSLRLVDLELAAEAGPGCPSSTVPALARTPRRPGYRAPEYGPGAPRALTAEGCRVEQSADLYSLGGLLFLLATGHDPQLADLPSAGPLADRLGRWLALAARTSPIARRLAPAVLGLRTGPPPERWPLTRARSALTTAETGTPRARAGVTGS
ncbi:hypothetical protein [Kitasatospora sp. NPDC050543]|uniref:protein kinase domain-containing protein n=1 Tax=Kitasatospora sp. NPDC050543 TaxID=3364054 RepID=UPI0037AA6D52